jgi:hypothetical protein
MAGNVQLSVSVGGATTKLVAVYVAVFDGDSLSVTFTLNEATEPLALGVPLIAPVVELIDIHVGAPTSEYVYGVVPPPPEQLAPVYATLTCAVAGNVQVNVRPGGATTKAFSA